MTSTARGQVTCPKCGSTRIDVPSDRDDLAYQVTCAECGTKIGTWGEIREAFTRKTDEGLPGAVKEYLKRGK